MWWGHICLFTIKSSKPCHNVNSNYIKREERQDRKKDKEQKERQRTERQTDRQERKKRKEGRRRRRRGEERKRGKKDILKGWREGWVFKHVTIDKKLQSYMKIMEAEKESTYRVTPIYFSC